MKNNIRSTVTAAALGISLGAAPALAGDLAIVLSPAGDPVQKKAEIADVLRLMTGAVGPGESAVLFDGLTGRSLCVFAVPDRRSYASDKAKINANRPCIGRLLQVAADADRNAAPGALDLPGSLRAIAESLDMAKVDAIVIFGSPIVNDPREPSVAMTQGHVPSDGHITSLRANSPYSMAGLEGRLHGTPIHFTSEGYPWALNNAHETAVHRFLWLTTDTLGGALVTFNADRGQMIDRVLRGVAASPAEFERASSGKLEMIQIPPDQGRRTPIHERPLAAAPLGDNARRRAVDVEAGISWGCECDMDIYVRAHPQAEIIYYGHRRTNEGQFYRDYRNGRELLNGLESVSFYAPVNLEEMVIGVNFYSGDAPEGVAGEIRISVGDKTYAKPFNIPATSGNNGAGAAEAFQGQSAPNDRWVVMTGADIVGRL